MKRKIINKFNIWLCGTILSSIGLNLFAHIPNYNKVISGIVFELFGSLTLGYVISMFIAKYKKNDWKTIWLRVYIFFLVINLITLINV